MEMPILKADYASDMAKLKNWAGVHLPKPRPMKQMEPEDGLSFSGLTGLVEKCENAARHEKLHTSREVLMTLQSVIKAPIVTHKMRQGFLESDRIKAKVSAKGED